MAAEQDWLPLPAGLRRGQPTSGGEAAQYGARARDRSRRRSCTEQRIGRDVATPYGHVVDLALRHRAPT